MKGLPTYVTKRDAVAEWLRNEVLSGRLKPGVRLHQASIARELSVSQTPVREAFRALEAEGLVHGRPHHAVVVADIDYADVAAAYEIRGLLEVAALRRGLKSPNSRSVTRLRELTIEASKAVRRGNVRRARESNLAFHEEIVSLAQSKVYTDVVRLLNLRSQFVIPFSEVDLLGVVRQHEAIVDALESRDGPGAVHALRRHLTSNVSVRVLPSPANSSGSGRPQESST